VVKSYLREKPLMIKRRTTELALLKRVEMPKQPSKGGSLGGELGRGKKETFSFKKTVRYIMDPAILILPKCSGEHEVHPYVRC
jgi:hypothetical protein